MRLSALVASTLLFFTSLPASVPAEDGVQLIRVWPGYRDTASFTRISEYFGGGPDAANRNALRSQPDSRAGYYWTIRADSAQARPGCTLTIDARRAGHIEAQSQTFPLDLPAGNHALQAGFTGTDWTDAAERPIAWRVTLRDSDGTVLASSSSFLWDQPSSS